MKILRYGLETTRKGDGIMSEKKYKYDAFISYRHTELDKYVAEKIHKYLEEFKLPKSIKSRKDLKKTKIERVFRDKEELTITDNLEDPIVQALKQSEYLIVICSPRIKESIWCRKEIEKFISFHGRNKVLTVLIEGEPQESFPDELLFEESLIVENGIETIHRKAVEPLAADIRGKSKSQMCKLLKTELLRVIAPIFGLEYDDLRQRHRERRIKKILTATVSAAILGLAIGIGGIASALIINSQKEKLLNNQADNLAKESLQYFEQDRRTDALKSAYAAVTEFEGIKMPYTSNGEYALTQALRIYDVGGIYRSGKQFEASANIFEMKLSPSKKYVIAFDRTMGANVWDVTSGKLLMKLEDIQAFSVWNILVEFVDDSRIMYLDSNGKIKIVDFINQKEEFAIDDAEYVLSVKSDDAGKYIAVAWNEKIEIYDASNGECIHKIEIQEGTSLDSNIVWCEEKLFYVEEGSSENVIKAVDINSKKAFEIECEYNRIAQIVSAGEDIYILAECVGSLVENELYAAVAIDKNGNFNWETVYEDVPFSEINIIENEGEQIVLINSHNEIVGLDTNTGGAILQESVSEGIADIAIGSGGFVQIISMSGEIIGYYAFSGEMYGMNYLFECNIDEINQLETCQDGLILLPISSNYLIKYEKINNEDKKEFEGNVDKLIEESTFDEEVTIEIDNSELIDSLIYTEDKKIAFITYLDMSMDIYDVVNKKVINSINQVDCAPSRIFGEDKDGNIYIASDACGYCFDKDYNLLWKINNLVYVDVEKNMLIIADSESVCWEVPIYSFEELLDKAEKEIK